MELEALLEVVRFIHPLSSDSERAFCGIWEPLEVKRKVTLTEKGHIEQHLYFVLSGVQRVFYFDDQGRESTLVFTYPPSFGGVLDSLMLQRHSKYIYETLTPSKFLVCSYLKLAQLMETDREIEIMIRKGITEAFSGILERVVELQCFSSEEKFVQLLRRSPHILQLVPHKYLANYLGIDATNFSKLINKVRI